MKSAFLAVLFAIPLFVHAQLVEEILVPLCDPAKLATLSERGANPRVRKIVYWLETARRQGHNPARVMAATMQRIGWNDERGALTSAAILRNLDIKTKLGCTDEEGMKLVRRGRAPTVRNGPYAGDILSVDHIIPRSIHPEFDTVLANLELMPLKLNMKKSDGMRQRQADTLRKFREAGLGHQPSAKSESSSVSRRISGDSLNAVPIPSFASAVLPLAA